MIVNIVVVVVFSVSDQLVTDCLSISLHCIVHVISVLDVSLLCIYHIYRLFVA